MKKNTEKEKKWTSKTLQHYEIVTETIADRIVKISAEVGSGWTKLDVCMLISRYGDEYDLADMAGYIQFCNDNPGARKQLTVTLIHDLMEFNRKACCFSPRTDGYAKYLKAA